MILVWYNCKGQYRKGYKKTSNHVETITAGLLHSQRIQSQISFFVCVCAERLMHHLDTVS